MGGAEGRWRGMVRLEAGEPLEAVTVATSQDSSNDGEDARIWVCRGVELRGGGLEWRITLII